MPRARAEDHGERRQAILDRAAELFARHGYDRASMAMIAEASQVSKALFYHYWKDKEELLFDVLAQHLRRLVEVARGTGDAAEPPRRRLEALAFRLLDAYRHADAVHQVQLNCMKLLSPARQEALKAMERELVAEAAVLVAALNADAARDRRLLVPLTMSFFAMLNWHHLWHREGRGLSRHDYARMAAALVAEGAAGAVATLREPQEAG
ncbi:TetR/AcrR family transcriptional regulator [Falsiroseomonas sp. CW058]|uniref:TetR/AcrR family transcriptional regulator n=1 Tax=Falsiroseomonas sp. CW058 TaxID=3388664 RepID=UPI003D31229D